MGNSAVLAYFLRVRY